MVNLDRNSLKEIISSVVKKVIAEEMHVINEKLFPLAEFIYKEIDKRIKGGENSIEFVVSKEEIAEFYPYDNPAELKIDCGLGLTNGKMEYKNGVLLVNIEFFYTESQNRCLSMIIHELTHFVNDNEGGIRPIFRKTDKTFTELLYFLRETECNARCSELGFFLKKTGIREPLANYEKIIRFNRIERLLEKFEKESPDTEEKLKAIRQFKTVYEKYKRKIEKIYSSF